MILKPLAVLIAALCLIAPALADDATPDTQGGRYIFSKQGDGFVRLDTQTGVVSLCSQRTVGWACEAAPEDRIAFEYEIGRLQNENAALKKDLLTRGLPLPPGVMPEPPSPQNGDVTLRLPSDADIDRMVALAGRVWHRFIDALDRAQKQVLNKS
jgi:hypothetical protein